MIREADEYADDCDPQRRPSIAYVSKLPKVERSDWKLPATMNERNCLRHNVRDIYRKHCRGDDRVERLSAGHVEQSVDDAKDDGQERRANWELVLLMDYIPIM